METENTPAGGQTPPVMPPLFTVLIRYLRPLPEVDRVAPATGLIWARSSRKGILWLPVPWFLVQGGFSGFGLPVGTRSSRSCVKTPTPVKKSLRSRSWSLTPRRSTLPCCPEKQSSQNSSRLRTHVRAGRNPEGRSERAWKGFFGPEGWTIPLKWFVPPAGIQE